MNWDTTNSVGARHEGAGLQVISISYPERVVEPSLSNTKVKAPVECEDVIGSGTTVPEYSSNMTGALVSGPS